MIRGLVVATLALGLSACAESQNVLPATTLSATESAQPTKAVGYLDAWADNDVRAMRRQSAPGSPARDFAGYWGGTLAAGRVDTDSPSVVASTDMATIRYSDGTEYYFRDFAFDRRDRLEAWTSDPGGPLAARIVGGPPVNGQLGPIVVRVRYQYRNTDDDLRITAAVINESGRAVEVGARGYVSPGGSRAKAAIGSEARTGIVTVPAASSRPVVIAVPDSRPGGRLSLFAYRGDGTRVGNAVMQLPQ